MWDCLHKGPFPAPLNFPIFPMFIISAPSFPPLTPLWLLSSTCPDLPILKYIHRCAVNGPGSHRNPLFSFLPIQKYLLNVFTFFSQRRFLTAILQGSYEVWSLRQVPCSCRVVLSGSALSGYKHVGK